MKIILLMAVTADGKIAKSSDHFPDWTSREDKKMFAAVSKKHGVVIMGEKTFRTFPKPLPNRLNVVFTLEKNPPETPGVKWVSGEPEKVLEELENMGYKSAVLGGGAFVNSDFLKRGLIDEIWLTVEPKIFGDGLGVFGGPASNASPARSCCIAAGGRSDAGWDFDQDLKLLDVEKINENSVVLKYKIKELTNENKLKAN